MFEAGSIVWRIQTVGKDVLKQDLSESEAAAQKAGDALNQAGKKTEDLGKKSTVAAPQVRTVRQEIAGMSATAQAATTTVGRSMVIIGAAVVAASALTVKAAIDWETAWTGVTKTVDGTPAQLNEIEDGLRGLTTELSASHSEIAAVAEAAGQLGVKADDIVGFTKVMIDLGETTNLTSNEAATSLAQLMNIFQTAPEDVDNLGSAIVELGNNGASTERDIVQMSQRIAGAARIIGLSEGETLGLANALASVGIEAEAGGSSVSNIMIDIANAVTQKGDKLLKWAELAGMGADEFAQKYRTKPAEALSLVIEGMGRLNDSGGDVLKTLSDLGQTDVRTTRSLLGLAGAGTLLRDSLELGNKAWADNTALQIEAEKRYETTAAKLEMAKNSIVDTAISLGSFLLPAVEAVVGTVSGFAKLIGALPPELQGTLAVLTLVVGAIVLAGGAAMVAVPRILAFKQAVGALAEEMPRATAAAKGFAGFLTGPWGIALTAAAMIIGNVIQSNAEYESRVQELTSTLNENTGAITDNTRASVAKSLQDQGAYANAEKLGISVETLTDAAMGQADAMQEVAEKVQIYGTENAVGEQAARMFGKSVVDNVLGAVGREKDALVGAAEAHEYLSTATDSSAKETKNAAREYVDAQREVEGLARELDELIDTLNKANGVGQDAVTKNIDYKNTLADVDEQIQKAREGQKGYSLTLDGNTQAGRDNMDMLVSLAKDAWGAAEAQFAVDQKTMGAAEATDLYRQRLDDSQAAILQRATDLGATDEQLQYIRDHIFEIPSETEWTLIADTAAAQSELDRFLAANANRSIRVAVGMGGGGGMTEADGGIVNFYANGGVRENHVAQFARAGDYRIWAEPETGGEAYIPLSPTKRSTSVPVLEETAALMGFQLSSGGRSGDTFIIYEAISGAATALAVQRRQSALGAV